VGVMLPAAQSCVMKKYPVDGAHARARTLRQNITEAERRIWQILRSNRMKGYKFRRQAPICHYITDFVCHEARLIVEIDGGQHDRSFPRETERSGLLQSEGYRILRFWNDKVLGNLDGVYQTIAAALGPSPPPEPSPIKGPSRGRAFEELTMALTRRGWPGPRIPRRAPVI
jgi:very-short-patch-repair endonuclease